MKLLLVFAFLAFVLMVRSAPTTSTTSRTLILQQYDDGDEISDYEIKPIDDSDDDDDTTRTTTTIRRPIFEFPTRNRNLIPSRGPPPTPQTQRTSSIRTTTVAIDDDDQGEAGVDYDGDFKYIRDFRKYVDKLLDDLKKLIRNLTGYDLTNSTTGRQKYNYNDE